MQISEVGKVLTEIGAHDIPQILVWNKIDLRGGEQQVERDEYGKIVAVRLSAKSGQGLDLLRQTLVETMENRADTPSSLPQLTQTSQKTE